MDEWLGKRGADWTLCAPTPALSSSPWFRAMPTRERLTLSSMLKTYPGRLGYDVSQNVNRTARDFEVAKHLLNTVIPNSKMWLPHLNPQRWMLGVEEFQLQGMDRTLIRRGLEERVLSDHLARDLAGNCYTGSVCAACFIAVLVHWPSSRCDRQAPVATSLTRILSWGLSAEPSQ